MNDVKIEINGLKEVQDAIRAYQGDISKQLGLIVNAAALEAVSDVKRSIERGPKTGNVYYRIPGPRYMTIRKGSEDGPPVAFFRAEGKQNLSPRHQASAPGQAPATDTGTLVSSIYNEDRGRNAKAIGSRLPYAFYLEFGTFKMDARPSWVPAVERTIPKMLKRIELAIAKAKARAEKTTK